MSKSYNPANLRAFMKAHRLKYSDLQVSGSYSESTLKKFGSGAAKITDKVVEQIALSLSELDAEYVVRCLKGMDTPKELATCPKKSFPISAQLDPDQMLQFDIVKKRFGIDQNQLIAISPVLFAIIAEAALKMWRSPNDIDEVELHVVGNLREQFIHFDVPEYLDGRDPRDILESFGGAFYGERNLLAIMLPRIIQKLDVEAEVDSNIGVQDFDLRPGTEQRRLPDIQIYFSYLAWIAGGSSKALRALMNGWSRVRAHKFWGSDGRFHLSADGPLEDQNMKARRMFLERLSPEDESASRFGEHFCKRLEKPKLTLEAKAEALKKFLDQKAGPKARTEARKTKLKSLWSNKAERDAFFAEQRAKREEKLNLQRKRRERIWGREVGARLWAAEQEAK